MNKDGEVKFANERLKTCSNSFLERYERLEEARSKGKLMSIHLDVEKQLHIDLKGAAVAAKEMLTAQGLLHKFSETGKS